MSELELIRNLAMFVDDLAEGLEKLYVELPAEKQLPVARKDLDKILLSALTMTNLARQYVCENESSA